MRTDFNQPQRQSAIGVLVMFADTLQKIARALWPILVIWIFKFDELNKVYFFSGAIAVFLGIALVAYLKYRNFTFYIDAENEELILQEGIFNKTNTAISLSKIQQVNINQSLVQRMIGVYGLEVDTAGSTKKEGVIKAISHALALALKARLMEVEKKGITDDMNAITADLMSEEERPFIKISLLSLLKVGITSNYIRSIGLILAFFITLYENGMNFLEQSDFDKQELDSYVNQSFAMTTIALLLAFFLLLVLVFNVIRIVLKYYNFKISKQNESLLLSFGLFNTKSTIIKPERVQITTVSQNYFQKKMNILELKIKQASSGEKEERKAVIDIPACNKIESNAILMLLFDKLAVKGLMLKPNYRKLVFALFLSIVLPLSGFLGFGYFVAPSILEFMPFVPVYVIFVGSIAYFGFRNYRLFVNDDFIIKQSGAWDIANEMIVPEKIQAITSSQLFWHKSADIGSITIHTAGGNLSFQLGDFTRIKHYMNLWLYEIETSDSNWM